MPGKSEVTVRICGAAGDGIASTGEVLARVASRSGLHVFAYNSYQSVIRGGHVWLQVRIGSQKVRSHGDKIDWLIVLNPAHVEEHFSDLSPGAGIIFNQDRVTLPKEKLPKGVRLFPLPIGEMLGVVSKQVVLQNTVALGFLCQAVGLNFDLLATLIRDRFARKGKEVAEGNVQVAQKGFAVPAAQEAKGDVALVGDNKQRLLMTGNQAFGLGAVAAGCTFYAAYPMTPASSIMHWLEKNGRRYGLLLKQTEDEIAAINMAIGAAHAGARAMTGTSGGGFSLMVEGLGLAGMTETPLVVVNVQRAGPSTGLPTKTEQADLNMMLGASQGDFPRIIIAPQNPVDCFYQTVRAFHLAEKYQTPVLLLSDLYLSEHMETLEPDALNLGTPIDRGPVAKQVPADGYKRYVDTPSGVSPRAFPGQEGFAFVAASDEHKEDGVVISDVLAGLHEHVAERRKMVEKRMRKLEYARAEMTLPEVYGPGEAEVTLVGWGSTQEVMMETVDLLKAEGIKVNAFLFRDLFPMPKEKIQSYFKSCQRTIAIEGNYTGQFARLLLAETGIQLDHHCHQYDGEPFRAPELARQIKEVLQHAAKVSV